MNNPINLNTPEVQGFIKYAASRMEYIAAIQQEEMEKQALSPALLARAMNAAQTLAKTEPVTAKFNKRIAQAQKFKAGIAKAQAREAAKAQERILKNEAKTGINQPKAPAAEPVVAPVTAPAAATPAAATPAAATASKATGLLDTIKNWAQANPGKTAGGTALGAGGLGFGGGMMANAGSGYDEGVTAGSNQAVEQLRPLIEQLARTYQSNGDWWTRLLNLFSPSQVTPDINFPNMG